MSTPTSLAYLWDPSAAPDAEIAALEQLLAPARLAAPVPTIRSASRPVPGRRRLVVAAFVCTLIAAAAAFFATRSHAPRVIGPWSVTAQQVTIESVPSKQFASVHRIMVPADGSASLSLAGSAAMLHLLPATTIELATTDEGKTVVRLLAGEVFAQPAGGPAIELDVLGNRIEVAAHAAMGATFISPDTVRVQTKQGRVDIRSAVGRFRLASGCVCDVRSNWELTTPRSGSSAAEMTLALAAFDGRRSMMLKSATLGEEALRKVLAVAGPGDGVVLWNLATTVPPELLAAVLDRVREAFPSAGWVAAGKVDQDSEAFREELWKSMGLR